MISFQCAWLTYPECWMAAFLDKEPETRKKAIGVAKQRLGFEIEPLNINTSGRVWEISQDGKHYPAAYFNQGLWVIQSIDQVFFGAVPIYRGLSIQRRMVSKLNKKSLDVLVRTGT